MKMQNDFSKESWKPVENVAGTFRAEMCKTSQDCPRLQVISFALF